jgi:hypothetical protein
MNIKRAVIIGAVLWVVIFFEVCVLMFGFGLSSGMTYYIIHYILAAIFLVAASLIYFKKKKGSWKKGLLLGIIFMITGTILDAVITVPLFVKDYSAFFTIEMLASYLEGIAVTTLVGALKRK